MNRIILSADSTCDLGEELKARYDVHYYPFHIILEEKDYQDNVDITVKEIFAAYYDRKALPRTAAINMSEYVDYFQDWVSQGYDVIHLNLGGAISSAHKNCVLAARELQESGAPGRVYPIDSFSLSTGIALQVIDAGEMISAGLSAGEIAQRLEANRPHVHASFILDTLDFMRAGGRCSTIAAVGANLLSLKPCIEVDNSDGSMHVGKKYRGSLQKVLPAYVKDKLAQYPHIKRDHIFITYSSISPELESLVRETIRSTLDFGEIHATRASCTIASHCGPNTLGILFETED
ncbi:DegV family protein [Acutalibacter sp. 1XD8-33]|uniref:DegV family protein n=1 Tax=Acutalibacter sp. 1XD8-33 TaxID=2320081 RepID=UPI000EA3F549|nr:DegV family protein [Acutalibacter sp. 1XD8-33]RKJ40612.1 DegV family protein [Acutalibacter sp. 1XD8-33]